MSGIRKWLRAVVFVSTLAMAVSMGACEFSNSCGDLVYDEPTNECVCPEGSVPDSDRNGCVFPNGDLIPWGEFDVPYARTDAGMGDSGPDSALPDAGPDAPLMDGGPDMSDVASPDAGPPPGAAQARFPWNGFATGSIHVPDDAPIVNHPLRPKLMWEEVVGADHFQVQMTRECAVAGFRECAFARPELDETTEETTFRPGSSLAVSSIAPVGSRYYWRVRACSASDVCSDWTMVRYVDVGRDTHDFNGDGYADVVVGDYHRSAPEHWEGGAFVYFGGPMGVSMTADVIIDSPYNRADEQFGASVGSAGDVNADGYADFMVGTPYTNRGGLGRAYLFLGGPDGPDVDSVIEFETTPQTDSGFGYSLGGGDFDGDGYADVAIGCPRCASAEPQGGAVYLFPGGSGRLAMTDSHVLTSPTSQENGDFGFAVSGPGDITGDGYIDLIISANAQRDTALFVYHGAPAGISPAAILAIDSPSGDRPTVFGFSLSMASDTNGDGYSDVVVGAPGQILSDASVGSFSVFLGAPEGLSFDPQVTIDNPRGLRDALFGLFVAGIGDINGDGFDAVMTGAPGHSLPENGEGEAYVFDGGLDGVSAIRNLSIQNPQNRALGNFGLRSVGAGDINGDGYADAMTIAPTNERAEVYVFYGAPSGFSVAVRSVLEGTRGSFGASVL